MISLTSTGGCILTDWEKELRLKIDPTSTNADTFLQQYLPFIPNGIIDSIPFITLGGFIGAVIQISYALRK